MNPAVTLFAAALVLAQFLLPRACAFAPLLICACHIANVPVVDVGLNFTTAKLIILAGIFRAAKDNTHSPFQRQSLDWYVLFWAAWAMLSGFFRNPADHNPITLRLSMIFELAGGYFYARMYLSNREEVMNFLTCLALVVAPFAIMMLLEKLSGQNPYSSLGAPHPESWVRNGRVRAAGPFGNAILAGTVGAVSFPLMFLLRERLKPLYWIGLLSCALIVFCSASSGPMMSTLAGFGAMMLWVIRRHLKQLRWGVIFILFLLHLTMKAPVWFLIARVDLAGGSTSWHRAELIDQAVKNIGEWWLFGTDYTRHWMPYGIEWSKYQADITNYYITMGVRGGVVLMIAFMCIMGKSFRLLGSEMREMRMQESPSEFEFVLWCFGASLFAHAFTLMAVPYFDQSYIHMCFVLGAVPQLALIGRDNNVGENTQLHENEPVVDFAGKESRVQG